MKTLTIGKTNIEITDFTKIRNAVVGVYAEIKFPKKTITSAEVWGLFDNNQHDLVVTEEDGSTTTYKGYSECESVKETKDEFLVTQICASEAMHRVNEANKQIESLETRNEQLLGKIVEQDEQMVGLEEASVMQTATLESLLLEVIPTIITETVTIAVAEALASNSPEAE